MKSSVTISLLLLSSYTVSSAAFSGQQPESQSRKAFLQTTASIFGASLIGPTQTWAAEEIVIPEKAVVKQAFDEVRYEVTDPNGGVTYLQQKADEKDFAGLMEFTKTYDLELRKLKMGKAKKLLQSKELKEEATGYANGVTFDLIGINRNSRKGQENVDGVNKYIQELRDDANKFLNLESTIKTLD
eukprot:CAMPEP_0113628392 /NCGR_PEP_ID=MMETSP0017_2-20120614/14710_1 /TAXON_ID=2856 /ORGANISM="Cylindrotheca closterium" /LENGTH=185 /DNA_ID=CAMNT_0000538693 /DNA_START=25 /DNA_END=582 /DNA_ORIENTATION=+ /assembly_acc=CAM_ASM_000147